MSFSKEETELLRRRGYVLVDTVLTPCPRHDKELDELTGEVFKTTARTEICPIKARRARAFDKESSLCAYLKGGNFIFMIVPGQSAGAVSLRICQGELVSSQLQTPTVWSRRWHADTFYPITVIETETVTPELLDRVADGMDEVPESKLV